MDERVGGPKLKERKQVAALPVMREESGTALVMLITSRDTARPIIPKGWPKKGLEDHESAAIEAREEAGLIGWIRHKSAGSYTYWKRRPDRILYCRVKVFILDVRAQLIDWPERNERRAGWLLPADAAELVDEPGLATIIRSLPQVAPRELKR
jgi:8-oxo-dGTP pyrophosphatase MutT (NUDIX family)